MDTFLDFLHSDCLKIMWNQNQITFQTGLGQSGELFKDKWSLRNHFTQCCADVSLPWSILQMNANKFVLLTFWHLLSKMCHILIRVRTVSGNPLLSWRVWPGFLCLYWSPVACIMLIQLTWSECCHIESQMCGSSPDGLTLFSLTLNYMICSSTKWPLLYLQLW